MTHTVHVNMHFRQRCAIRARISMHYDLVSIDYQMI